jgi:hypothetical protein
VRVPRRESGADSEHRADQPLARHDVERVGVGERARKEVVERPCQRGPTTSSAPDNVIAAPTAAPADPATSVAPPPQMRSAARTTGPRRARARTGARARS